MSGPPITTDELAPGYSDGENEPYGDRSGTEGSERLTRGGARSTRASVRPASSGRKRRNIDTYNSIDEMSDGDESDASGDDWDSEKNDNEDEPMPDLDDDNDNMSEADEESDEESLEPQSLILKVRVPSAALARIKEGADAPVNHAVQTNGVKSGLSDINSSLDSVSNGDTLPLKQGGSSPLGPSGYPTPTSLHYVPGEQKVAVKTTASAEPPTYSGLDRKSNGHAPTDGILKEEHRIDDAMEMTHTVPANTLTGHSADAY